MSRRIGQAGNVFQRGFNKTWNPEAPAYGRYWIDVPGSARKREVVPLGVCSSRSIARRKLREHIEREGINSTELFHQNAGPATTFGEQAERWIASLPNRGRKPVKPATIYGWRHSLDKWLLPYIGDTPLSEIGNAVLKGVIDNMRAAGLSAQSIVTHSRVVKMVVASAVNNEGEQLYPRKWNHDFIGLPIIEPRKQRRPTITKAQIEGQILTSKNTRWHVLFALLAGTGLRIGETLGLKREDLSGDCTVLHVRRSIWHRREQAPKTPNAFREVDIPDALAALLREYTVDKPGYLFSAQNGEPLDQRNVLRALHATGVKVGFHAFRRFRMETLRRAHVPKDLIDLWLGHAKQTVGDLYALGLEKDEAWRREWCERAGLGFSLNGLLGLQNAVAIDSVKVA